MKNISARQLAVAVFVTFASCGISQQEAEGARTDTVATALPDAATKDTTGDVSPAPEDVGIPPGIAGVWVVDPARVDREGADAEAALTLCEGGRATYAVFTSGLFVFMRVTRAAGPNGEVFSFFYEGEDASSDMRSASLRNPPHGALLGTGRVEETAVLLMDWKAGEDYIASIRAAAPNRTDKTIFPQQFYHNIVAMAGLCEETE